MATGNYSGGGYDPARSTNRSGSAGLDDAAHEVRERAGAILDDAKDAARSKLNEQKDVAARGLDGVAEALRETASRKNADGSPDAISEITGSAADGLERLSNTLRSKDISGMLRDMESFARNQPVAFFGLSLAAGFLAVRFLKATDDRSSSGDHRSGYGDRGSYSGGARSVGDRSGGTSYTVGSSRPSSAGRTY